ncbi:MAG: hypothetical protein QME75_12050 [Deltaproteobacteria bacterium]|nr:hypothetical protein [Deltaproteobacteria bacterium]
MSIRYLAEQLYHWTKKVKELEQALASLGEGPHPDRAALEAQLFRARKERDHFRSVLEAKKEKPLV